MQYLCALALACLPGNEEQSEGEDAPLISNKTSWVCAKQIRLLSLCGERSSHENLSLETSIYFSFFKFFLMQSCKFWN